MQKVLIAGATGYLGRYVAQEFKWLKKEEDMTVLVVDLVAPTYGQHHLRDFFLENKSNV